MATEIIRPSTAFSLSPGKQKRPRVHDDAHLKFIRRLPCLITGRRPVEACHVRFPAPEYGKRGVGMGEKPDDRWSVPMVPELHRDQHSENEQAWWKAKGIDPIRVALALWGCSEDDEAAELILATARGR